MSLQLLHSAFFAFSAFSAFPVFPVFPVFGLGLFAAILRVSTRRAWFALLAMLPWTLPWPNPGQAGASLTSMTLELPQEPAMLLLTAALLLRGPSRAQFLALIRKPVHPVVLVLVIYFVWQAITTCTSALWLVGVKELLIQALVCISFFVAPLVLFAKPPEDSAAPEQDRSIGSRSNTLELLPRTGLVLACSLAFTVLYTGTHHSAGPYLASDPWFRGHIEHGQVLAISLVLLLPALLAPLASPNIPAGGVSGTVKQVRPSRLTPNQIATGLLVLGLGTGLLLARSRSAFLLLLVALPLFLVATRHPPAKRTTAIFMLAFLLLAGGFGYLVHVRNAQSAHPSERTIAVPVVLRSVTAWTREQSLLTEESMTERFNRWDAAVSMAKRKPLFGTGPGTFEQTYAPFQNPRLATRISTNQGDLGDAHSHYLEALAEQGLLGLLLSLLLFLVPICSALHNTRRARTRLELFSCAAVAAALGGLMFSSLFSTFLALQEVAPLYFLLAALAVRSPTQKP